MKSHSVAPIAPISTREERNKSARVEFDHWRKAHPDFTSAELLENWRRIRAQWGLAHDRSKTTLRNA